ncbi:MAG: FkbM family methyltransferase [Planktothrix sp.]
MNLLQMQLNYESGLLEKPQYIDEMYKFHQALFEYSQLLRATDIAKIEIVDDGVIFTSRNRGVKIYCDQADKRTAPFEILNFKVYEKVDSEMIFRLIEPGFNVFDIGANIGWYSLNIAKIHSHTTKIWSFEPIPKTFSSLTRNVAMNEVQNIQLHNFGFSNEEKELKFYVQPEASVSASSANITGSNNIIEIVCHVKRLDDFIRETGLKIDFIKCDVEGGELFVYQGGLQSIQINQPIIFTEMLRKWSAQFNYHPNEIINLLSGIGYRCFTVKENYLYEFFLMEDKTVETNFFFLHSEKHSAQIQALTHQE